MNEGKLQAWGVSLIFASRKNILRIGLAPEPTGVAAQTVLDALREGAISADDQVISALVLPIPPELIAQAYRAVVEGQKPEATVLTLHAGGKDAAPPIETQQAIYDERARQNNLPAMSQVPQVERVIIGVCSRCSGVVIAGEGHGFADGSAKHYACESPAGR